MLLEDAIALFLRDLSVGRSAQTHTSRRVQLARWVEFLEARDRRPVDVAGLTDAHLVDFARWVSAPMLARNTADALISAVSTFYAFLVREAIRPDLPLVTLRMRLTVLRGRKPQRLPRVPADDVVDRLAAAAATYRPRNQSAARSGLIRLRNIAIVETLRGSGLRVSEVCGLRRGDLATDEQTAIVLGKGNKERRAYFTDAAWSATSAYLALRGDHTRPTDVARLPVFARHDAKVPADACAPMSADTVRGAVHALARDAGVLEAKLTPHRFRAWFATHVLAATGDLAAAQDLLGHADPATTRMYATVTHDRLRQVHARAFRSA